MLVDLKLPVDVDDRVYSVVSLLNEGRTTGIQRIDRGLYTGPIQITSLLHHVIAEEYPYEPIRTPAGYTEDEWFKEMIRRIQDETYPNDYGVVDYPQQLIELFPRIDEDPRPLVVGFAEVRKGEQPDYGGWRWHKWGPYYGTQEPQYEYIYDEPNIESVWTFHIVEIKQGFFDEGLTTALSLIRLGQSRNGKEHNV